MSKPTNITASTRIAGCWGCGEALGVTIECAVCLAVRSAVEVEREACAVVADGYDTTWNPACVTAYDIAEAIRARGPAVCEAHKCEAPATTSRTDIGGTTFALCAKCEAEGEQRGYWRARGRG